MTRAQLLDAGLSHSAVGRALRAGRLHLVYRGVYAAVAPELLTEEGHLVAAVLAAGDGALLRHGTAAWRWRIISAPPSMIELALPRDHAEIAGLTLFVSRNLRAGDTTGNGRFPTTSVPRTLLDLATRYNRRALRPRARGSRVPPRPAPGGRRAHAAPRPPGQRQPPRRAEGARARSRRDEEPPRAPLPRPPHPPPHRAAGAQRLRRAVDGRLPLGASSASPSSSTGASTSARARPTATTTATSGCAATATWPAATASARSSSGPTTSSPTSSTPSPKP